MGSSVRVEHVGLVREIGNELFHSSRPQWILETNREAVINLRDALIEHKVVEADAVAELLS